mmetsp:Transcript_21584/g.33391  ORF Transcript_21584/g.33391 Transcript_21584/m.33391 type:complete len:504 (+) Transcript_21584:121-1632(+)
MTPAPNRRQRTGNRRRGTKRHRSRLQRHLQLSHAQVGFMATLQHECLYRGGIALIHVLAIPPLALLYAHLRDNIGDEASAAAINVFINYNIACWIESFNTHRICERLDYILHDIPPEEHQAAQPSRNIRFNSWDDHTCYIKTTFDKNKLLRIYRCFVLEDIAAQNNGYIRIPTGYLNQRGVPCVYNFHPEELFLYFMTRMKTGNDHTQMCDDIFGGSEKRWSLAWRWILFYLDERYKNIIGHQGLLRFVDDFPRFYTAIQQKVQQSYVHDEDEHNNTHEETSGLAFLPFDIFGFIDCSIDRINRPFSGPAGDYEGAGRKPEYPAAQRAFYTGFKKLHGIKVETVFLPNGISTIFGPVSARRSDIPVLQMSNLNEFLVRIQIHNQHEYSALGDSAYHVNLRCICSYFKRYAGQQPLTDHERRCNRAIKKARESIEYSYGLLSELFHICSSSRHNRLAKEHPYAIEQLRAAHLLCNIYVCLNGEKASGHNMFCCRPPVLEDYLTL